MRTFLNMARQTRRLRDAFSAWSRPAINPSWSLKVFMFLICECNTSFFSEAISEITLRTTLGESVIAKVEIGDKIVAACYNFAETPWKSWQLQTRLRNTKFIGTNVWIATVLRAYEGLHSLKSFKKSCLYTLHYRARLFSLFEIKKQKKKKQADIHLYLLRRWMLRGKRFWEEVAEVSCEERQQCGNSGGSAREERVMTGKGEWTEITSDFVGKGRVRERERERQEDAKEESGSAEGEFIVTQDASFRRRKNTQEKTIWRGPVFFPRKSTRISRRRRTRAKRTATSLTKLKSQSR